MKKFITLLLVLTGMVSTAMADDYYWIYVKSSNPTTCHMHLWGDSEGDMVSGGTSWPGPAFSTYSAVTVGTDTYYVIPVVMKSGKKYNFKCSDGTNQTSEWTSMNDTRGVEYNGGTTMSYIDIPTVLTANVAIAGEFNNWQGMQGVCSKSDDTYTYVLNSESTSFKVLAFNTWKGTDKVNILSHSDWFGGDGNIELKYNGYSKYTFTLTQNTEDDSKWDLTPSVSSEDAYRVTIAGNSAILNAGEDWALNAANDMSDEDLDGTFHLLVTNKHLSAGNYDYKAFRDGKMDGWHIPADASNQTLTIAADGDYNIIYTLNRFTLTAQAIPATVGGTISASGWNTFSSNYKLDLSTVTNGKAFVASAAAGSTVTLTSVEDKIVAAGTGLMIKGTPGKNFTISTTFDEATFSGTNKLVGLPDGGTVAKNSHNYVFGWTNAAEPGFYYIDNTEPTLDAGKSYLHTDSPLSARLFIDFEENGDVTGIANVNSNKEFNGDFYNLNGQKVQNPTKGLYIVNGKKAIIK